MDGTTASAGNAQMDRFEFADATITDEFRRIPNPASWQWLFTPLKSSEPSPKPPKLTPKITTARER